jgi:peptide deformylase
MIKKILTFPNEILQTRCNLVNIFCDKKEIKRIKKIVDSLMATATNSYGDCLGLSANQIGYNDRIFVMRTAASPFFHFINPEIVARMDGVKRLREACLSRVGDDGRLLPGISVRRAKRIKIRGYTYHHKGYNVGNVFLKGPILRREELELKGIDARVFQHELDHLNGVVI